MEKGKEWESKGHEVRRYRRRTKKMAALALLFVLSLIAGVVGLVWPPVTYQGSSTRTDDARVRIAVFESGCKSYMMNHDGVPPPSLEYLVDPKDGSKPYLEGGLGTLQCPIKGAVYEYDPTHVDANGKLDPVVSARLPDGRKLYSSKRQKMGE